MRFICSGWGRARSATGWFSSASLGHRIHRTAFAKELKGHRERDAPLFRCTETGDGLKARFLAGFAACLAADRKSVENRGFGVAVRKVRCHRGEDGTVRVSSVETMHERRYTVDDWRYDTADCEQTENGQKVFTITMLARCCRMSTVKR